MNNQKAQEIVAYILQDVFGRNHAYSLEEVERRFAFDIPIADKMKCALSGKTTWTFSAESEMVASQEAIAQRFQKDEWMRTKESFHSMEDVLRSWKEIHYVTGEKRVNSKEVASSDGIYNSVGVYRSVAVFNSKNIVYSYKIFESDYMAASRDNSSCTLGMRVKESLYCSSCFEVSWSNKVAKSLFVHDGFDLYECMFCSHLRSKKYCIANMQFEKTEYLKIKGMVIDWVLKGAMSGT